VRPAAGDVLDLLRAGELAELAQVAGEWTVIDFWAAWCEACKNSRRRPARARWRKAGLAALRVNIVDFVSPIATRERPGVEVLPHLRQLGPGGVVFERSGPTGDLLREIEERTR
jgi:thiol:disulfide interchange protein